MDIRSAMLTRIFPVTALLFGVTSHLIAAELKYTYAEAKYVVSTDAAIADDSSGFGFKGSYQIDDTLFATAEFSSVEEDDFETQGMYGGLGYIHPISQNWNGEFIFSFGKIDMDYPKNARLDGRALKDDDDTGYILKTGARALLTPQLEFRTHVCYQSFFDTDWTSLELSTDYRIKSNVSASLGFGLDEEGGSFTIGGKVYF
jgi:hypothetical protein